METSTSVQNLPSPALAKRTRVRWQICGCLFLVTTISYIHRSTTGILWQEHIMKEFDLNDAHYGLINFAFTLAYALAFPFAGRLLDRFGVRKVLAIAVVFWSLAAMGHALVGGFVGLIVARFLLGVGEAATFPACVKTAGEWLPKNERALGAGIFNAGANAGLAVSLLTVGLAAILGNWRGAFIATGIIGLLWVWLWLRVYHPINKHPRVNEAERDYILAGLPHSVHKQSLPWTAIIRQREAWPFLLAKFLTDPVWWFYLFWLVPYLKQKFNYTDGQASAWLLYISFIADIGSIFGGWLSGHLINRGWDVAPARYTAMGICAAMMPVAIGAIFTDNPYLVVTFIALATAGHQGMSSNLFTTTTDIFPAKNVGAINGMAGIFQGAGSMLMTLTIGIMLNWLGTFHDGASRYAPAFIWAGFMHPLAVICYMLILGRKFKTVDIDPTAPQPFSKKLFAGGIVILIVGAVGLSWTVMNYGELVRLSNLKPKAPASAQVPATTTAPSTASVAKPKEPNQAMAIGAVAGTALVILIGTALMYAGLPRVPKPLKSEDGDT